SCWRPRMAPESPRGCGGRFARTLFAASRLVKQNQKISTIIIIHHTNFTHRGSYRKHASTCVNPPCVSRGTAVSTLLTSTKNTSQLNKYQQQHNMLENNV